MRVRVGLLDIAAFGALVVALILPMSTRPVTDLYIREKAALREPIAQAQADLAHDRQNGSSAAKLCDLLVRARQSDWALRACAWATAERSPERWRAMVAVSAAHADRLEIGPAYEWASKAQKACEDGEANCDSDEKTRLDIYVAALKAGFDTGIDPKVNPNGFVDAVRKASPLIRVGKPK